jgi:hypothetical protein
MLPYEGRKDEVGRMARALTQLQKMRGQDQLSALDPPQPANERESSSQKIDPAPLVQGLSAHANQLALNATMKAVKSHHLDVVAEKANELAQRTSYNSQELLKKLNEIKMVCDDIQNQKPEEGKRARN